MTDMTRAQRVRWVAQEFAKTDRGLDSIDERIAAESTAIRLERRFGLDRLMPNEHGAHNDLIAVLMMARAAALGAA